MNAPLTELPSGFYDNVTVNVDANMSYSVPKHDEEWANVSQLSITSQSDTPDVINSLESENTSDIQDLIPLKIELSIDKFYHNEDSANQKKWILERYYEENASLAFCSNL